MILFILEGRQEEKIANTIKTLFFEDRNDDIVYCYENNIYQLYHRLKKEGEGFENITGAVDILSILKEKNPDSELAKIEDASDIEETYLFFDYDFQWVFRMKENQPERSLDELLKEDNQQVYEMLEFFSEETEMGRLFINYPMIESLYYTKQLLDDNYITYEASLDDCRKNKFKQLTSEFTAYQNRNQIAIADNSKVSTDEVKANWQLLKEQNVKKANYLCAGKAEIPSSKDDIAQDKIFKSQIAKYNSMQHIGILNSFPLFLFYYFK